MTGTPVFDGANLRATLFSAPGPSDKLIVTFDFRQPGKSDFGASEPSGSFSRNGFAQLTIQTRANDWFINDDTRDLERRLAQVATQFTHVHALGWSMGGYGAFRFARCLRASTIVAVSPQATLDADLAPFEWRYKSEALAFDKALGRIPKPTGPGPTGLILADPFNACDLAQARLIQTQFPDVRLVRLAGAGHPATRLLRASGKAWLVQREAQRPGPGPGALLRAHKAARSTSAAYYKSLSKAASRKHPALADWAQERAETIEISG